MASDWDAEIEVDEAAARALIAGRFPALDVTSLRRLGEGWDNTVWATADGIAFRFPRRAIAIPGVRRELALLPHLAARLPAAIPDAAYPGEPNDAFAWPWFGSALIPGAEVAAAAPLPHEGVRLATELGAFLRALHALELDAPADTLELDPMGRADLARRIPRAQAALDRIAPRWDGDERARRVLAEAVEHDGAGDVRPVLVHGDLNLRHALVNPEGGLAGVIDWGDMCRAPRSVDLALYWSLFGPAARAAFRDAYGPLDGSTLARARVLALFFDAMLVDYAHATGMAALEREALRGLHRTLTA